MPALCPPFWGKMYFLKKILLEISAQFWFLFTLYILLRVDQQIWLSNVLKLSPPSISFFVTNYQTNKQS